MNFFLCDNRNNLRHDFTIQGGPAMVVITDLDYAFQQNPYQAQAMMFEIEGS